MFRVKKGEMKARFVLVMLVVGAATALWLLRQAGVEVPGRIWTILLAGLGLLSLLSGLLLKLQVVRPSALWGWTALGATLVGVGTLLLVISRTWGRSSEPDTPPEVVIGVIGLVSFVSGFAVEYKARRLSPADCGPGRRLQPADGTDGPVGHGSSAAPLGARR